MENAIIEFDKVDSTMLVLHRLLQERPLRSGDCILARYQSAGRGRLQRVWHGGEGRNLTATFWIAAPLQGLTSLPLVAALAVCDALESLGLRGLARCKWPNDVLAKGRKICGILCQYKTLRRPFKNLGILLLLALVFIQM